MLKNYILVAYRNLSKNKSHVIINVMGSGIAIACCLIAYLLIAYNLEFDSFQKDEKVASIYAIHTHKVKK